MATSQLSLYNGALRLLGERKLATLSENREPRRVLDDAWDGAVKACLEEADWKFAQRTARLVCEASFTATFGYQNQFLQPDDLVRWSRICTNEIFTIPLLDYVVEAGSIFTNYEELYISYVSNDASYGMDYALWPESFVSYVEARLAESVCFRLTQSETKTKEIAKALRSAKINAKSKDALQGPTRFLPTGSWVTAKEIGRGRDRGSRSTLIG